MKKAHVYLVAGALLMSPAFSSCSSDTTTGVETEGTDMNDNNGAMDNTDMNGTMDNDDMNGTMGDSTGTTTMGTTAGTTAGTTTM